MGSRLRKQVWDRRRKRYTDLEAAEGKANLKRIRTESGIWIPASYKTDKYKQWLKRTKTDVAQPSGELGPFDNHTTYSARYGSVVQFSDEEQKDTGRVHFLQRSKSRAERSNGDIKKQDRSFDNTTTAGCSGVRGKRMTVLGTQRWTTRANANQRERALRSSESRKIRQPKGSRTFGQLRRPEQVLKQRRVRAKMVHAAQKNRTRRNKSHGSGSRKKAPTMRRK